MSCSHFVVYQYYYIRLQLLREVFLADLSQGQTEGNDNVEGDDYGT